MRNNKIYNKIKWSLVSVAVWTMSFSPAAMGQQPSAYNYTVEQLQDNIKTLGLNKRMTLGQFFEKNKHLMPERVRREVETAISDSRNVLMPDFEVVSAKTTTGEVIPTIRISNDRELVNLQWFGEKNKVVKYGAANISEVDIANFNDMFARVLATDANLRKQYEPKQISRMQTGFKYPDVTRAEWKTMSLQAKVSYIQDLRAVWESANAVLAYKNKSKPKNGALFNFQQKNNLFFELFLGQDAVARTAAARPARTARVSSASSCLVAGYMSEYVNGVCSVERAKAGFANDELTRTANEACNTRQAGQIACNPFIYGTPNGEPRCITPSRTDADFQRATHFDGPCERDNHLQSAPEALDLLNDPAKRAGRYAPENLKKSIADLEAEQAAVPANIELSKNYILGVLKFRGTTVADFNTATFSEANLEQIMQIRDKFKVDIERARSACSEVANAPGAVERNYLQACDQLHRRFLFVDAALATRCQGGGLTYRADTMKCACTIAAAPAPASPAPASPAPAAPAPAASPAPPVASTPAPPAGEVLVPPGARCPAAAPAAAASTTPPSPPPVPPVPPAPPAAPVASSAVTCDESGSNPDCVCPSGARPRVAASDSTGAVALASSPCAAPSTTADPAARSCNFLCKIGRGIGSVFKFAVNNAPILLAAGVSIYLITKLAPKKPALAAPADKCPNGSIAPCVQQCTGSLVMLPTGSCGCPACVLGQTSNSACECVSSGTNTPTTGTKLCGDGTYVNVTTPCPTYACWNGSSYENPTQCPSQVPAAESTRVRSGN